MLKSKHLTDKKGISNLDQGIESPEPIQRQIKSQISQYNQDKIAVEDTDERQGITKS